MDDGKTSGFTKHPTLYFHNGDIAIAANHRDGGAHIYRVDRAFLSRYSPIFADMLSLPAPLEMETFDGVPLVHLPDAAQDVEALLEALYDPSKLMLRPRHPDNPLIARPLLTMATKYDISYVCQILKQQICADWPTTFEEYEGAYAAEEIITKQYENSRRVEGKALDDVLPEPASAIRLAMDFDIPSILPAAFMQLASRDIENDWDDLRGDHPNEWDLLGTEMFRTARWSTLHAADLLRLSRGKAALVRWQHRIRNDFDPEKCGECQDKLKELSKRCCTMQDVDYLYPNPMDRLQRWCKISHLAALCAQCHAKLEAYVQKVSKSLWEDLPDIFSLDDVI